MSSAPFELKHEIVRAGAGAGKTTNLTDKVVDLANEFRKQNGRWPQLVVTTFTRKATQELKERMLLKACKNEDMNLLEYLSSRSRLQISTIHGVLSLFLRKFGPLYDFDPGFTIVSEREAEALAKAALKRVLPHSESAQTFMQKVGSATLVSLLRSLLEIKRQYPDSQPCAEADFKQLFEFEKQRCIETLTAITEDILAEADNPKWIDYANNLNSLLEDMSGLDSGFMIREALSAIGRKPPFSKKNPPVSEGVDQALSASLKEYKALFEAPRCQPETWELHAEIFSQVDAVSDQFNDEFSKLKRNSGKFEMSDLELEVLQMLRNEPAIAKSFSESWDFWLIDEYQDTSPLQVEILSLLIGDTPHYVVGDPQQSIYLFRGARSEVFTQKEQEIEGLSGNKGYLRTNYRSKPELLLFFNDFFTAVSSQFEPMEPKPNLEVKRERSVAKFFQSVRGVSGQAQEKESAQSRFEAENENVAHRILELNEQGAGFDEICVLARTNKALVEMAQHLKKYQIPTHVHASSGFFQRREVMDALALLKFLANPHDNQNLILLLRSPWCRIPDHELFALIPKGYDQISFWKYFLQEHSSLEVIEKMAQLQSEKWTVGLVSTFEKALINLGFFDLSLHHDPTGRRESNLWKLVHRLRSLSKQPGFTVQELVNQQVRDLSLGDGAEETDAVAALEPNCVNLMTVHASKGLKFNHVILSRAGEAPQLQKIQAFDRKATVLDNKWSFAAPIGETDKRHATLADRRFVQQMIERELQEQDRLLYVALTRAVDSVCFCYSTPFAKNSWMERLKWDLSEGLHQRDNYHYEVVSESPTMPDVTRQQQQHITPRTPWQVAAPAPASNAFKTFSVSHLLSEVKPEELQTRSVEESVELLHKAQRGQVIHRLAELLKYHSSEQVFELSQGLSFEGVDGIETAIEYLLSTDQLPLQELIKGGEVEFGFQLKTDRGLMEGQIDLWGVDSSGVLWIVDYKSGSPKYSERAFSQLQLYSLALRQLLGVEQAQLAVVYPFKQKSEVRQAPPLQQVKADFSL